MPSIYINSSLKRTTRRELPYYPLPCVGRVKINAATNFLEGSIVITKSAFDIVNKSGSHKGKVLAREGRYTVYMQKRTILSNKYSISKNKNKIT